MTSGRIAQIRLDGDPPGQRAIMMLWQPALTELQITPVPGRDFDRSHPFDALLDDQRRERPFGRAAAS